jgi:hypothetical protein
MPKQTVQLKQPSAYTFKYNATQRVNAIIAPYGKPTIKDLFLFKITR